MPTYGEALRSNLASKFVGRQDAQSAFLRRLSEGSLSDFLILNVHGQTGMGKSFLLLQLSALAETDGIPTLNLNIQKHNTPWLAIQEIFAQLAVLSADDPGFRNFEKTLDKLGSIENKLHQAATTLRENEKIGDEDTARIGEVVGGVVGSVTGVPLLSIVGSGIGSIVGSKIGRAEAYRLFRSAKLKDDEVHLCLNAGRILTRDAAAAVNELATGRHSCALMIDVYEQSTPTVDEWLRLELIPSLETNVALVIAGRISLQRLSGWDNFIPVTRQIELTSFTSKENDQFWKLHGIEDTVKIQTLHEITRGHPFICGLLADIWRSGDATVAGDVDYLTSIPESSLIIEKLLKRFTTEFETNGFGNVIRTCAVPRWFDRGLLEVMVGPEIKDVFEKITRLSFVIRNKDGSYSLHELARTALLAEAKSLDPDWVRTMHHKVAEHLASRRREKELAGVRYMNDELYHRLSANEGDGLLFGRQVLRSMRNFGAQASLDPLVREIAEFTFSSRDGEMWRIFCSAQDSLRQGDWDMASQELRDLLLQPDLPDELRLWVTELHATILTGRGKYRHALALQEDVIRQLSPVDRVTPHPELTEAYYRLIEICGILSKFADAEAYHEQAMNIVGNDPLCRARLLLAQASCHRLHGRVTDGLKSATEAVSIYKTAGDPRPIAFTLIQLSRLMTHDGSWVEAEARLDEAEQLERPAPYEYDVGNIHLFRGNIYRRRRDWVRSIELYEQALTIHQRLGALREIGPLYTNLGIAHYALGKRALARRYLEDGLRLKEEQDYVRGVGISLKHIADLFLAEGDHETAISRYRQARNHADHLDILYLRPWARIGMIRAHLRTGDLQACQEILADDIVSRTAFQDLRATMLLYRLLIAHLSGSDVGDSMPSAEAGLRCGLIYNPYSLYRTIDVIADDTTRLVNDGKASATPIREFWESVRAHDENEEMRSIEHRTRSRERIQAHVPTYAGRITEYLAKYD